MAKEEEEKSAPNKRNPNKTMNDYDELSHELRTIDGCALFENFSRASSRTHATYGAPSPIHTHTEKERETERSMSIYCYSLYARVRARSRIADKTLCSTLNCIFVGGLA